MKFSVQEQLVPGTSFQEKVSWLERNGFDGIEVWGFNIEDRVEEINSILKHSTIQISAMCAGYAGTLFSDDPKEESLATHEIKELLHICSLIKCPGLVIVPTFGTSKPPGILTPHTKVSTRDIERFANTLAGLGEAAGKHGVKLYLEPINRYESHVFNTFEENIQVLELVNNPNIVLLADTFHMNIEEKCMFSVIEQSIQQIGYFHLADSNRLLPSLGHIDYNRLFTILRSSDYQGFLSLECFIQENEKALLAYKSLLEEHSS